MYPDRTKQMRTGFRPPFLLTCPVDSGAAPISPSPSPSPSGMESMESSEPSLSSCSSFLSIDMLLSAAIAI